MATKAEQEADYRQYEAAVHHANTALAAANAPAALRHALAGLDVLDGATAYARRYLKLDPFEHPAHEILFRTAPWAFDAATLDAVEEHLDANRKLEKASDYPFRDKLAESRQRLNRLAALWDSLPCPVSQIAAGSWEAQAMDYWIQAGCVIRVESAYRRSLDLDAPARGKCPYCGALSGGRKLSFCRERACPKCGAVAFLVLLAPDGP